MEKHPDDQKYKRITQMQLKYFITFAKKHPELMRTKTSTVHTKQYIEKLWEHLAEVLNDMHGPSRTPARWKDAMRNWKKQLRCRTKKAVFKNPCDTALLEAFQITELDQEALEVFGYVETEGNDCTNLEFEEECEIECNPIVLRDTMSETPAKEIFENIRPSGSKLLSPITPNSTSSEDDATNQSEDSSPPKKNRKYSTQQMFTLVLESMKKREEREEKMVEALLKLGEGLLAVANAIALKK